jgi:hypothetical protein
MLVQVELIFTFSCKRRRFWFPSDEGFGIEKLLFRPTISEKWSSIVGRKIPPAQEG